MPTGEDPCLKDALELSVLLDDILAHDSPGTGSLSGASPDLVALRQRLWALRHVGGIQAELLAITILDAKQVLSALDSGGHSERFVQQLVDRLRHSAVNLIDSLPAEEAPPSAPLTTATMLRDAKQQAQLDEVVKHYGTDAERESRTAWWCTAGALVLAISAAGAAVWTVTVLTDSATESTANILGEDARWTSILPPVTVTVLLAVLAVMQMAAASRARRAARESLRIQRGLAALDGYLAPLPPTAQHLVRATMTQSLFPRLLEDDDPLRHVQWPDAEIMVQAVYDYPPNGEMGNDAVGDQQIAQDAADGTGAEPGSLRPSDGVY